jgi:hypothetical protein
MAFLKNQSGSFLYTDLVPSLYRRIRALHVFPVPQRHLSSFLEKTRGRSEFTHGALRVERCPIRIF